MAIYLKIDGIEGSCSASGHEGWIELESVSHGVSRNVSTKPGKSHNREQSGSPSFQEIHIAKEIDISSPDLYRAACTAKVLPNVTIDFCQTDKELYPIVTLKLTDVIISLFDDHYLSGDDLPRESLSLNFVEIEKSYTLRDRKNKEMTPKRTGYNLETAEVI